MLNPKDAFTEFERLKYDGVYSIVKCLPHTGRMHQIRKHLAMLGFPIANDLLYKYKSFQKLSVQAEKNQLDGLEQLFDEFQNEIQSLRQDRLSGEKCTECNVQLYNDPDPDSLLLWLHASRYYALDGSWDFSCPSPNWCSEF